jgi:hypothetical protein
MRFSQIFLSGALISAGLLTGCGGGGSDNKTPAAPVAPSVVQPIAQPIIPTPPNGGGVTPPNGGGVTPPNGGGVTPPNGGGVTPPNGGGIQPTGSFAPFVDTWMNASAKCAADPMLTMTATKAPVYTIKSLVADFRAADGGKLQVVIATPVFKTPDCSGTREGLLFEYREYANDGSVTLADGGTAIKSTFVAIPAFDGKTGATLTTDFGVTVDNRTGIWTSRGVGKTLLSIKNGQIYLGNSQTAVAGGYPTALNAAPTYRLFED